MITDGAECSQQQRVRGGIAKTTTQQIGGKVKRREFIAGTGLLLGASCARICNTRSAKRTIGLDNDLNGQF